MKRALVLLLFTVVAVVLSACGSPGPGAPSVAEVPLISDADLDAASVLAPTAALGPDLSGADGSFELLDLLEPDAVHSRWTAAPSMRALPAVRDGFAGDTPGQLVYVQQATAGAERFSLRLSTVSEGGPGRLIYRGVRRIESAATSADGGVVTFTATSADGDLDVYLLDRDGAFGRRNGVYRLPANPAYPDNLSPEDETDVSMSLDGAIHAWQSVDPVSGTADYVVVQLDRATGQLGIRAFTITLAGTPISTLDPSVSGDGSLVSWVAQDPVTIAALGAPVVIGFTLDGNVALAFAGVPGLTASFEDPSTNADGSLLLVKETFDGTPFLDLYAPLTNELFFPLEGLPIQHPNLTADGAFYAVELQGAIYALPIDLEAPAAGSLDRQVRSFRGFAPMWSKELPPPPPPPAGSILYSGTNDTGLTFMRPDGTGPTLSGPVGYHAFAFTSGASGVYDFRSEQDYDGYLTLYRAPFDPQQPLVNVLAGNDDLGTNRASGFRFLLEADTAYVLITSACGPVNCGPELGTFDNIIIPPQPPAGDAVPRIELFTTTPLVAATGEPVTATWYLVSASAVSCSVDWGDGAAEDLPACTIDAFQSVSHSYTEEGHYTIEFSAQNLNGATTLKAFPTVANDDPNAFDIVIVFANDLLTAPQRLAFEDAAARWAQVITGDLPPQRSGDGVIPADFNCLGEPTFNGSIDDVVISASGVPIDGVGSVLASAGPCLFRADGSNGALASLPAYGAMRFDTADLANLESSGTLFSTILHEMGHVIGIGTLWLPNDLVAYLPADADCRTAASFASPPVFTGANAIAGLAGIGGVGDLLVEDEFAAGTQCSHWDEAAYGPELMTGFTSLTGSAEPLSAFTVGSLADLGYRVDPAAADPFDPTAIAPQRLGEIYGHDVVFSGKP